MTEHVLPLLYTLFLWWFSTGAILYLDGRPRHTYRWSLLAATTVLAAAFCGLVASSAEASVAGAYIAFTCGLLIWGWHEMSFLMGFVTGGRRSPCPPDAKGWRRFNLGLGTILHHELAIAATAAAMLLATWGAVNQVGLWTFLVLWGMRLSAKLNVFLGVPNLTEEFLPDHLSYLKSYFRRSSMTPLFPLSVTLATVVLVILSAQALTASSAETAVGLTLISTLLALAVLEHWFLVLPLPDAALWRWAMPPVNGGGRDEDTARQERRPLRKARAGRKEAGRANDQEQRFDSLGLIGRGVPAPGSIE